VCECVSEYEECASVSSSMTTDYIYTLHPTHYTYPGPGSSLTSTALKRGVLEPNALVLRGNSMRMCCTRLDMLTAVGITVRVCVCVFYTMYVSPGVLLRRSTFSAVLLFGLSHQHCLDVIQCSFPHLRSETRRDSE
jgi:hypothetical protein